MVANENGTIVDVGYFRCYCAPIVHSTDRIALVNSRSQTACRVFISSYLMCSCRVGVQRLVGLPGDVFRQRVERAHRQVDHAVEVPLQNVRDGG